MTVRDPSPPWGSWLQENAGRFLLFARQQARTDADAHDVLQDAMVRLWKRTGGPGTPPPDAPLAFATIRRAAIDRARGADRRSERETRWAAESPAPDAAWFDPDPAQAELAAEVRGRLDSLSSPLREAIILRIWGDLSFAEIAKVLEIPLQTAASRCRLALEQLRRHFCEPVS